MLTATIRKLCPSLNFIFCLIFLEHCLLKCDTICCSIYLIDFGGWLLFKAFVAAKLVSVIRFGTLL
jgi:hypothetical protein